MEETDKVKILVYGTLKEGQYNYDRLKDAFGEDALTKVEDRVVEGFDMYDLGFYPAITRGAGNIHCELMEASPRAAKFIRDMELGAGYEETLIGEDRIYTYGRPSTGVKIESGRWNSEYTD